jgi:hypothetical protein
MRFPVSTIEAIDNTGIYKSSVNGFPIISIFLISDNNLLSCEDCNRFPKIQHLTLFNSDGQAIGYKRYFFECQHKEHGKWVEIEIRGDEIDHPSNLYKQ